MIEEVPNDNFQEELRQKTVENNLDNVPHQQTPPSDILYYFEVRTTVIITVRTNSIMGDMETRQPPTINTFYSSDMDLLEERRKQIIKNYSSNNTFPPTVHSSGLVEGVRTTGDSRLEYQISAIQSAPLPLRIQGQRSPSVESMSGTFSGR